MNCESCKYYKETYLYKGYCSLWKNYVKSSDGCEDGEDIYD